MNFQKRIFERNRIFGLIRIGNRKLNIVRYNPHNSDKHEDFKWQICKELQRRKVDYITEAIFESGQRADVLAFNIKTGRALIIEILASESISEARQKTYKYPDIEKIFIKTKKKFDPDDIDI